MIHLRSLKKLTVERIILENRQKKRLKEMKLKIVFWFYVRIYIIKFFRVLATMITKFLALSLFGLFTTISGPFVYSSSHTENVPA